MDGFAKAVRLQWSLYLELDTLPGPLEESLHRYRELLDTRPAAFAS